MRAAVVGVGAVGGRAARQLLSRGVEDLLIVDRDGARAEAAAEALGPPARTSPASGNLDFAGCEVVLLAGPAPHEPLAARALEVGASVVSCGDDLDDVGALLRLDAEAHERGLHLVIGAGFSPGLSCVLARHAARGFERVDEIHVAKMGIGGPSCARQRHRALGGGALDWRDGAWVRRAGGSGRELCWFPDPVRGVDCYRGAAPEALLMSRAMPGVRRVTARLAANRRDRLTAHLPMLRPPHPEGGLGAVRVEVRGRHGNAVGERVLGAVDRAAVAAAAVMAVASRWVVEGRLERAGAAGLGSLAEPGPFLVALAELGVKVAVFEGAAVSGG
ncbi:MAG: NAD(P)-binding domain-containing protein [Acidimicrobiales bacterium]